MSYIPDCRHKYAILPFGKRSRKPNPYWYKILDGTNASEISGYDMAVDVLSRFFDSFDNYEEIAAIPNDIADALKKCFDNFAECNRNEIVTSMIENMDDEHYEDRRRYAWENLDEEEEEA